MSKSQSKIGRAIKPSMNWVIWLFPVIAIVMAGFVFYDHYQKRGPLVKIHFNDASGVESYKTALRFRGINVGVVENVRLTEDTARVVVEARLDRDAAHLAVEGTKFYIIQPEVSFAGVRGLETLFKGPYIRVEQGGGERKLEFDGFAGEPNETVPGTIPYFIKTHFLNSIDQGDSVSYRGLKIGTVTNVKLEKSGEWIQIQINVERKYMKLIRTNTMFWPKVGIYAKLSLFKSEIKVNSLESLMKGGIDIATPNNAGGIAPAGHHFGLSEKPTDDYMTWAPNLADKDDKSDETPEEAKKEEVQKKDDKK